MTATNEELIQQNEDLQTRLDAAEEALRAIQSGEVDALVIYREGSEQIYTLEGANSPYRVMVETIQEGVATLQTDGMILYANLRLAEMLVVPLENLLGSSLLPYIQSYDHQLFTSLLRKGEEGTSKGELTLRRKDGSTLTVLLTMNSVESRGQRVICMVATDLTEQKRSEETKAAERLARSILEQAAEAIVVCDTRGTIIRASQTTEAIVPDNPLFQTFEKVFPLTLNGGDQVFERFAIDDVLHGLSFRGLETRLGEPSKDRTLLLSAAPLRDERDEIIGCIVTLSDISERKRIEQILRESEERFRFLANAMPQLVWTAQPEGAVDYYNDRYLEYDVEKQQEPGLWQIISAVHPDDLQPSLEAWGRALKTGDAFQTELRFRKADGSYRWHLNRAVPIFNDQGEIIKWYGTATDIHDQKQAETQLAEFARKLRQSNQELEEFAFVASHDLQEPLRKIIRFGDSLADRMKWDEDESTATEAGDYLRRIRNAAERMQAMIDGLLDLSRISTQGKAFGTVHLTEIAEEVVSDLEPRVHKEHGQVQLEALPDIEGDPLQMRQLLQNLIGNAVKFHQPGVAPVVRISSKVIQASPNQLEYVHIQVADNGIGFDEQDIERIFQPFQRLHGRDEYEGTGMGLAICQKIVERHHGKITVHSQPGEGSAFVIELPLRQAAQT